MANNLSIDPIKLLKDKNDAIMDRYKTFNQKVQSYLTILAISLSTLIILFKEQINNITKVFVFTNIPCEVLSIHILLSIVILILTLFFLLFLIMLIKEILNALNPITLTEYDYEAIDLIVSNKAKEGFKILVKDYKYLIEQNQNKMNEKYNILFSIRRNFILFAILYLALILFVITGVVYGK